MGFGALARGHLIALLDQLQLELLCSTSDNPCHTVRSLVSTILIEKNLIHHLHSACAVIDNTLSQESHYGPNHFIHQSLTVLSYLTRRSVCLVCLAKSR